MASMCSTPAAAARSITASRSSSKSALSRWQWESIMLAWGGSLQASSYRNIFEKSGQHGLAAFERRGHDHAVGFDSAQFSRLEIRNDYHLAADHLLRLVRFGDAGDDGPRLFFADVHLHVQKFVGAFHAFGAHYLADAQVHFHKIIDRDFGCSGFRRTEKLRLTRLLLYFEIFHFDDRARIHARKDGGHRADFLTGRQFAPVQVRERDRLNGRRHAQLDPNIAG